MLEIHDTAIELVAMTMPVKPLSDRMGSAREVWSVLLVAQAVKYIAEPDGALQKKFDHVIGTLHRCIYKPKR